MSKAMTREQKDRYNANRRASYADPSSGERAERLARNRAWAKSHPERRDAKRAWAEKNKEKLREYSRVRTARVRAECRQTNPELHCERVRAENLRRSFGLTLEQYDTRLVAQNGVCALCRRPETAVLKGKLKRLAVDHDHLTGKVRGLLCSQCNTSLGMFGDDPSRLRAAADYLERHH